MTLKIVAAKRRLLLPGTSGSNKRYFTAYFSKRTVYFLKTFRLFFEMYRLFFEMYRLFFETYRLFFDDRFSQDSLTFFIRTISGARKISGVEQ